MMCGGLAADLQEVGMVKAWPAKAARGAASSRAPRHSASSVSPQDA